MKINHSDYDCDNIISKSYYGANLVKVAYDHIGKWDSIRDYLSKYFDRVYPVFVKETDSEFVICVRGKQVFIIVPGTSSKKDVRIDISSNALTYWLLNRNIDRGKFKEYWKTSMKLKTGINHTGFEYCGYMMYEAASTVLLSLPDPYKYAINLFGHSLSAAGKSHLAYYLYELGKFKINMSIGFGSPDPGRVKFSRKHNERIPSIEITNESDIVKFSTPGLFGYKEVGTEKLFINHNHEVERGRVKFFDKRRFKGRMKNRAYDGSNDHYIPEYIEGLGDALNKGQSMQYLEG